MTYIERLVNRPIAQSRFCYVRDHSWIGGRNQDPPFCIQDVKHLLKGGSWVSFNVSTNQKGHNNDPKESAIQSERNGTISV